MDNNENKKSFNLEPKVKRLEEICHINSKS